MKKYFMILLSMYILISCDDGKIYGDAAVIEREGSTVEMSGIVKGVDSWPGGYSVVIAGFGKSEYADISKTVPVPEDEDETISLTMGGIGSDVTTLELCVIDRLRRRVVTFYSMDCDHAASPISMEVGTVDVGMYNSIQKEVFDTYCISCHGLSGQLAAGVNLTEENSYDALVNQVADKDESESLLVKPGDVENSYLHKMLNSNVTSNWRTDHMNIITSTTLLTLIDEWISSGAKE